MPVEDYAERAGKLAAKSVAREPLKGTRLSYGWGDPETEAQSHEVNWVHVPARSPLAVVILSEQPVHYFGHWGARTMFLCAGPSVCTYCARGMGGQHRYAFSVYLPDARAKSFLEVPAAVGLEILRVTEKTGFLRGLAFVLWKDGQRANGKIRCKSQNVYAGIEELPAADDPAECLLRQFGAETLG